MTVALSELLELEQLDLDLFRSRYHRENFRNTLFGGQVLGQALAAAAYGVSARLPNSLHAYFLRPGTSDTPVIYDVERVRDGSSFSARRVVARQQGRPIFNMSASFHEPEQGYFHAQPMPANIPGPEELRRDKQQDPHLQSSVTPGPGDFEAPFEFLPVEENLFTDTSPQQAQAHFWLRAIEPLPENPALHYCALAFASDFGLLATALLPHEASLFDGSVIPASVDHAMWFHSSNFRIDQWLLYVTDSPWAGGARGFGRGSIYTREGELIASTAQEGLIRPRSRS